MTHRLKRIIFNRSRTSISYNSGEFGQSRIFPESRI